MDALQAMDQVFTALRWGRCVEAQELVLSIEAQGSTLPSSVFERVLRAACEARALMPAYAKFCERGYGKAQYAKMVREIVAELNR